MHTSKDDYLFNTLRFVSRKEASQKYGVVLPDCLTSPAMKESKAYKTYLGFATGAVPPKAARKFKKASQSKKDNVPIPEDEEPVKKGKRLKTTTKKSAYKPATGIVIKEPAVETKSKSKEKEKVDVAHGKGIELLSDVALTEEAQMKEVHKKSLRDFHKTYLSGSGTVAEDPLSVVKITPPVTNEGTGDIPGVLDVTNDDSSENARLEEPTETATGIVQGEGTNAEMTESQQGNENLETTQEQVVEDAHVTISTVTKKTEVPVTSSSRSSDLASKFLNFSDIPHTDAEIISPLDVPVHHEVPRTQAPTLLSIPIFVIPESSPVFTNFPQSSYTFTPIPILATPTPPLTIKTSNPLANLPDFSLEVSNFAPPVIEKLFHETRDEVTLAKASSQPQSTYKAASTLTEFELKKILLDKMEKSESYLTAPEHRECYDEPTTDPKKKDSISGSSKGTNSQPRSSKKSVQSEEPVFEVADSDMPQDQERDMGDNEDEPRKEIASTSDWFKKPIPVQEPTDPDWRVGKTT
ncbi:hypothetical protein Tco_1250571 [Tanacetum coccineum]